MNLTKFAILAFGLILASLAFIIPSRREQAQRNREITAAIDALQEFGANVDRTVEAMTRIRFRDTALDDQSLPTIAIQLKAFKQIYELDLRRTRVTGKTLAALSGLDVSRIILDPDQINPVSIQQLNECHSIRGIKLSGDDVTEEVIMGLVPALREWKLPGGRGGELVLDAISAKGLGRLESEVPTLRGVQTSYGWQPIADAWRGPK